MRSFLLAAAIALAGCASARPQLPTVHWQDKQDALRILSERADAVQTMSAQGLLTLVRPDGESVRFDLAMARQGRDRLRLRAWKLGRAVFDLTMNEDGVWLLTPDDPSLKEKARAAGAGARKLADGVKLLNGDLFRRSDIRIDESRELLICTMASGDETVKCDVDRRTLTPLRYQIFDPAGIARFKLELSDYRMIQNVPIAEHFVATSDAGRIIVALRDVELNAALPDGAFKPPRRAEKLP